jgi:hypothetical protein
VNLKALAMFDVLGFKALRQRLGAEGLKALYHNLVLNRCDRVLSKHILAWEEIFGQSLKDDLIGFSFFSDTIIIYSTNDDDWLSNLVLLKCCEEILIESLSGKTPLRGALVAGELIIDGSIIIGEAVEKAYEIEQKQLWSG